MWTIARSQTSQWTFKPASPYQPAQSIRFRYWYNSAASVSGRASVGAAQIVMRLPDLAAAVLVVVVQTAQARVRVAVVSAAVFPRRPLPKDGATAQSILTVFRQTGAEMPCVRGLSGWSTKASHASP